MGGGRVRDERDRGSRGKGRVEKVELQKHGDEGRTKKVVERDGIRA